MPSVEEYVAHAHPRLTRLSAEPGSPLQRVQQELETTWSSYATDPGEASTIDRRRMRANRARIIVVYEAGGAMARLIGEGDAVSVATETTEYPERLPY